MPRNYLVFGDIQGKLNVLTVECTKCIRKGRYHVQRLIEVYGRKGNMSKWLSDLKGDCPKRQLTKRRNKATSNCHPLRLMHSESLRYRPRPCRFHRYISSADGIDNVTEKQPVGCSRKTA